MGHPVLTSEEIKKRNSEMLLYAKQYPDLTNAEIGAKFGIKSETARQILERANTSAARNARLAEKAKKWGFKD